MTDRYICDICGSDQATEEVDIVEYTNNGQKTNYPMYYKSCKTCMCDYVGSEQSKKNMRSIIELQELSKNVQPNV